MPSRPVTSVATGTPPSRLTAAATAWPTEPAAPVMSTILSLRRAMVQTREDGRQRTDKLDDGRPLDNAESALRLSSVVRSIEAGWPLGLCGVLGMGRRRRPLAHRRRDGAGSRARCRGLGRRGVFALV